MKGVFGDDDLGEAATILFQSATTKGTDQNYTSNLKSFFEFCHSSLLDPQKVSPSTSPVTSRGLEKGGQ